MSVADDLRLNRDMIARLRERLANLSANYSDSHDDCVGITQSTGTYPSTAGMYFSIAPAIISGNEIAGTVPTIVPDPSAKPILAICLGPNVPALGAKVCYQTDSSGHFVFNY